MFSCWLVKLKKKISGFTFTTLWQTNYVEK